MTVTLMQHSSLEVCAHAIRTCWQSYDKSDCGGPKDLELIDRVGNKFKHASTLEHLSYTFFIDGISRALLQELARHRMASLSVKSTRYTLKELKDEEAFNVEDKQRAEKYLVMTSSDLVNEMSIKALENLREVLQTKIGNDVAKYCLPESYKTSLTWTINARSLQNFISLRTSKSALWEIRDLANAIFEALPQDHKYLFESCVYTQEDNLEN
ncbi:FAD-dependent thymidylate synthase [Halarcobacter anaerophilus]|uniref:Flavin-dependent thymidylate synthase n=1 Tax=Halarcobacter anaerophilus TaxID=877500 RepID=A0A4V1LPK4_9BACT|nr:FAD-dependent thymidylate synthase [Halarcobacter anaerophilus]QDF30406.1 thymidylate synthase, flavin-dependent [Halarcobacter anaerophilus]RXJ61508.1 thymidylate synthase (FAD) [Halarcobacter anaerophilus]